MIKSKKPVKKKYSTKTDNRLKMHLDFNTAGLHNLLEKGGRSQQQHRH